MELTIKWKDYEIRKSIYLADIQSDKWTTIEKDYDYDIVKWEEHEPREVIDAETGKKKISTRNCYSIASLKWDAKERCFRFSSVRTRYLEDYTEGLNEFILGFIKFVEPMLERESDY